jgi:hypothetical protein
MEMTRLWKSQNDFHSSLEISLENARFPHSHSRSCFVSNEKTEERTLRGQSRLTHKHPDTPIGNPNSQSAIPIHNRQSQSTIDNFQSTIDNSNPKSTIVNQQIVNLQSAVFSVSAGSEPNQPERRHARKGEEQHVEYALRHASDDPAPSKQARRDRGGERKI